MTDEMFLIPANGELVALTPTAYASEYDIQALLATHPELLAGSQISPEDPRRWLLINREQGLADRAGGSSRWSVDHLFIDHEGIPTIVEVKRSSNTQIRREIVGQMLDYAANGLRYWPVDRLRQDLASRLGNEGEPEAEVAADALVRELVGPAFSSASDPVEEFWLRVDDNLSAGRLRLLFVADIIPPELVSVIEFLNDQMTRTEVLGIEVRQYTRGADRLIVPKIVGRTREAAKAKGKTDTTPLVDFIASATAQGREVGSRLEVLAATSGWIEKRRSKSIAYEQPGRNIQWCSWWVTYDSVGFYLGPLKDGGMTDTADALIASLAAITNSKLTSRNPEVTCAKLLANWEAFETGWLPSYVDALLDLQTPR